MAKFKIDYLKNDDTILPLIDYVTGHNNINTYSCYDEQLEKTTNSECTLTFKMMQYIYRNGEKVLNVYAQQLTHGAQLRLREKDDTYTLFVITRVDYAISSQNIELSYTAIDLFHYALSRRNQGYTILNDSDNFIGALHFNDWVKKIQDECYLSD